MSILNTKIEEVKIEDQNTKLSVDKIYKTYEVSGYNPNEETRGTLGMILRQFALADVTMQRPRPEFNDMSVIQRAQYDRMSWNTYQPNNGDALAADTINAWRSNAKRPIIRNKTVSIAAHATARLIFPKVFAYDDNSDEQQNAAIVMRDLMEWAADKSDYSHYSLMRILTALIDPVSIGYTEYVETYRDVKIRKGANGKWETKRILDDDYSGFQDIIVPCEELYIENVYEPDIQKQGWLIWRKTMTYSQAEKKYAGMYENFIHIRPGMQLIYNDANQLFYQVYDPNMRTDMVEEIIYWNKTLDVKLTIVNGVMLTDFDNPNPRNDKKYPFDTFYYEMIHPKYFYGKSLAFKLMQDDKIANNIYNLIVDGTFLNVIPPTVNLGGEIISSDVMIPGATTTLSDKDADLKPIRTATDQALMTAMRTLDMVDSDVSSSSQEPLQQGLATKETQTAYEISRLEQNAATVLGLFLKMISKHVKEYGKLRLGDILQYLTIADVDKIEPGNPLVYKTFLLSDKQSEGKSTSRKIDFKEGLPENITDEEVLMKSYDILAKEDKGNMQLFEINPKLFRELTFNLTISPDILQPKSEDLERAYNLEIYDKMIVNPLSDQEQAYRLLLGAYEKTRKDPDKYINKQTNQQNPLDAALSSAGGSKTATPTLPGQTASGMPQTMGMSKL